MSALGQKRTCALQWAMSALPPKADMCSALADVRFGPKADINSAERRRQLSAVAHSILVTYSLALLFRPVVSSFLTSSGDSFGRSIVSVSLSIFPVNLKGIW